MSKSSLDMQKVVHEKNMDFRGTMYIQINVYIIYSPGFWRAEAPKERTNRFRYTYIYIPCTLEYFGNSSKEDQQPLSFHQSFLLGSPSGMSNLELYPESLKGFAKKSRRNSLYKMGHFTNLDYELPFFYKGLSSKRNHFLNGGNDVQENHISKKDPWRYMAYLPYILYKMGPY